MTAGRMDANAGAVNPWRFTSWIAGIFVLLVGIGMVMAHVRHKSSDPWRSPALLDLKAQLLTEPRNEDLKQHIRELDLGLRERYFHLLSLKATGVHMIFGGTLVLLYSGNRVRQLKRQLPMPQPDPAASERVLRYARLSRNAVATCGVLALAGFSVLAFSSTRSPLADADLLSALLNEDQRPSAPIYTITAEQLQANWTRFRGYQGAGIAPEGMALKVAPAVSWHTTSPVKGFSSPLIWEDRLLLTGGDRELREVVCLNANTGELAWRRQVDVAAPASAETAPDIPDMTGYAASTPATDGKRVYTIFASGELAAFTLDGQPVWSKHLGVLDNPYGHAASLAIWRDQVVVQLDQGYEDSRTSKIIAFDGRTGEMTWQKARLVGASWCTPIVIEAADKPQVIALGLPWTISYAASDGTELWRAKVLEGEITPSPIFANERLILVDPGMYQLLALRPDGSGDVTETHVEWRTDGEMPDVTSPVSSGELVVTLTTDGTVSAFDAVTGESVWEQSIDSNGQFDASPSIAGETLILVSTGGELIALSAGRESAELWRMQLEDEFHASPAFAKGRMFLRGKNSIWCLGDGETKLAEQD